MRTEEIVMKNNIQLVEYAKAQIGSPYWFGTFGQIASENLLNQKASQYPKMYTKSRIAKAKKEHLGQRVHDCMGLIKGFIWSADANSAPKYKASEDWSADAAFEKATEKGPIATIPEIPGVLVRYRGHVGVYIGGGKVIEARGFDYGVVSTRLKDRKWLNWYKHPLIEYAEEGAAVEEPPKTAEGIVATRVDNLNIRAEATTRSRILGTFPKGTRVTVELEKRGEFYKLADRTGYVAARFIKLDI